MSSLGTPLCVMVPEIGLASETFLRWEIEQLLPGRTAVIGDPPPGGLSVTGPQSSVTWELRADQPALVFAPVEGDPPPSLDRHADVARFLDRQGVQVVLVEYLDFADRWFDLLTSLGVRVWLRAHGADVSARLRTGYADRYRRYGAADGLIVPSMAVADRLTALGIPASRIHVVAHAVDVPDRPRRHGSASRGVRCVSVGRLVGKKGPLHTLQAFRLARLQRRLSLDLVGDGPLRDDVDRYVSQHDLGRCVRRHGPLDHARTLRLVRRGDILLHHAVTGADGDSEGQPLVILEAMAAGLAVVATRHPGIPEIITDGVTGLLVDEGDTTAMAEHVVDLAKHPEERARLGAAARETILARHTTPEVRAHLHRLLRLTSTAARIS